MALRIN